MPSLDDIRDSGQARSKNSLGSLFDEDGAFDTFRKHGISGLDKNAKYSFYIFNLFNQKNGRKRLKLNDVISKVKKSKNFESPVFDLSF